MANPSRCSIFPRTAPGSHHSVCRETISMNMKSSTAQLVAPAPVSCGSSANNTKIDQHSHHDNDCLEANHFPSRIDRPSIRERGPGKKEPTYQGQQNGAPESTAEIVRKE